MELVVGNVWTVARGEAWELTALRSYLTIDPETPSFLQEEGEDDARFLTGLLPRVQQDLGVVELTVTDERSELPPVQIKAFTADLLPGLTALGHELRPYQLQTGRKMVLLGTGIAEIATGGGKTALYGAIVRFLRQYGRQTCVVLVDRSFLVQQTISEFIGKGVAQADEIGGLLSDPYMRDLDRPILVGTVQSFSAALKRSDMEIYERLASADILVVDECHHAPSKQAATVIACCNARERFGGTATMSEVPGEWGPEELMMEGLIGPLRAIIPGHVLREMGYLAPASLGILPIEGKIPGFDWRKAYNQGIIEHRPRNSIILSAISHLWDAGRKSLVFVAEKLHGRRLMRSLAARGVPAIFVTGGGQVLWVGAAGEVLQAVWTLKQLADYVARKPRVVTIATQVLDEGVDVPAFNVAVLAGGHKKMRRLLQRIGRTLRPSGGETLILDCWDTHHPFLQKHSKRRMAVYAEEKIPVRPHEDLSRMLGVPFILSQALPYLDDWEET